MKITIEETDKTKAKRLVACDDCFGLLWDIDQKLRSYQKYETTKPKGAMLEELREMIHSEGLLDLWQ